MPAKTKKTAKPKSHSKAKKAPPKIMKVVEPVKPIKVHPFAAFLKGKFTLSPRGSAPMQKLSNHDTYRKKAI